MEDPTLAAAIRRAQNGEAAAFDRIFELYAGRVFGFLYRSTRSRHEAEDLMQEVFVRVVRMIRAYDHSGRFEPWLFRIAANLIRDRIRRYKRSPRQLDLSSPAGFEEGGEDGSDRLVDIEGAEGDASSRIVLREDLDALNGALTQLPDGEREVVLLRHFSQMSFKEIAELMGTPLGTALARAHRGLARLRQLMESPATKSANAPAANPVGAAPIG